MFIDALLETVGLEGMIMMPPKSWKNLGPEISVHPEVPKEYRPLIRASWPAYGKAMLEGLNMRRIMTGQILLIICFVFYLVWWYRGFRPGTSVKRLRGLNGILLALTMVFGIGGVTITILDGNGVDGALKINPAAILISGVGAYIVLMIVTRFIFHRIVTSELLLIVGWTMLELWAIVALNSGGSLSDVRFTILAFVLAAAFIVSIILYVAYYRMEEMKAFYTAMIPLIAAEVFMVTLVGMVLVK